MHANDPIDASYPHLFPKDFGERLARLVELAGPSLEEFAERLGAGGGPSTTTTVASGDAQLPAYGRAPRSPVACRLSPVEVEVDQRLDAVGSLPTSTDEDPDLQSAFNLARGTQTVVL